jgi:hypothetical protein
MRQIENEMVRAINAGRNYKKDNTEVICGGLSWNYETNQFEPVRACVYLHGNLICKIYTDGRRAYSTTGWNTTTTRSRLQALGANCRIFRGRMIDTTTGRPFYSGRL